MSAREGVVVYFVLFEAFTTSVTAEEHHVPWKKGVREEGAEGEMDLESRMHTKLSWQRNKVLSEEVEEVEEFVTQRIILFTVNDGSRERVKQVKLTIS